MQFLIVTIIKWELVIVIVKYLINLKKIRIILYRTIGCVSKINILK